MSESVLPVRKIVFLVFLFLSVLFAGTFGFILVAPDSWTFLDAFYFTLITLTTIGYSEVHSLSYDERLFTIFLIVFGVGITYYIISTTASIILEGRLNNFIWKRKMARKVSKQSEHYIICGYGRIGEYICNELDIMDIPFVVIEDDSGKLAILKERNFSLVEGNATVDSILLKAGINEAKGLAIAVGNDSDSVFITLSARYLNPSLYILARYEQLGSDQKLLKAGATRVLSPHVVSGGFMVQLLFKPDAMGLFGISAFEELAGFVFEEITISGASSLCGIKLSEVKLKERFDLIPISVHNDKRRVFAPDMSIMLEEGDILIVFGDISGIKELKEQADKK